MRATPVRFIDHPAAMRRFLEALGLRTTVVSGGGTWIELQSGSGGVSLHAVAAAEEPHDAGSTSLSFESDEPLEAVRTRLAALGHETTIIDETYGRSLRVVDPDGETVGINESPTDSYGSDRTP